MRNYWSRGVGNKTGPLDYLEHHVPLFRGELGKQDSFVSKGVPYRLSRGFGILSNLGMGAT